MALFYNKRENSQRIREPLFQVNRLKYRNTRNSESENLETNLIKIDLTRISNEIDSIESDIAAKVKYFIGDVRDYTTAVNLNDGLSYSIDDVEIYDDQGRYSYPNYRIGDIGPGGGKIFITPLTTGNTTGKYFEVAPIETEVSRTWPEIRTNLCTNPSFETSSFGYGNLSNTTLARVAGTWGSGAQVLQVTCTNATGNGTFVGNNGYGAYPVTGGLTYTVSLYAKHISGTPRAANVIYLWTQPTGNTFGGSGASITLSATPQRVSTTVVAPANATGLTIWITCYSSGTTTAADVSQWDMCLLEQSSTVNSYFDGSTNSNTSWAGTVNNSASIKEISGADETAIGSGEQNTIDIVAESASTSATSAAVYCSQLTFGDKSDWFLPSLDELYEIYINSEVLNSNFTGTYFSSSEVNGTNSWAQSFALGTQNSTVKSAVAYVRPVRAFTPIKTLEIHTINKLSGKLSRLLNKIQRLESDT